MATKTISIDLDAYHRLVSARTHAKESFTQVIKRAEWEKQRNSCGSLLARLPDLPVAEDAVLERLEAAQASDTPPDNPWA